MGVLIVKADFVGKFLIASDNWNTNLDSFIDDYEENYLSDLMGSELYDLFKLDLTNKIPVTPKYLTLYNSFRNDYGSKIITSKGLKNMLLGFIYFEYMRQVRYKNTVTGSVVATPEISTNASDNHNNLYKFFNESVNTFEAIRWKIQQNKTEDYPTYNGQCKELSSWF